MQILLCQLTVTSSADVTQELSVSWIKLFSRGRFGPQKIHTGMLAVCKTRRGRPR